RPIVLQIFGAKPDNFYKVGILARELGFDGVDLNMGCPDDAVCRQGAGIALIKTPDLAQKIIRETKRGAGDLPVSVKTRIGYNKIEYEPWILSLLSAEPAVLTIHARTKKDMSKVPARWEIIGGVVQLVRQSGNGALVIGNGDVVSLEDAKEKARVYGVDGVMIGRGVFGNPWFFNPDKDKAAITLEEKLGALTEHLRLFESLFSEKKNFAIMKKHFSAYIAGYPSVKKLKIALMGTHNGSSAEKVISDWLSRKSIWQWFKRVFSSF
ncbi:MAG: tRNA-dihydrouridine synthase, partial [Parcubacteria group bacterium]|nr:tRNA-dihydrouridine synthase [Parcubacteria group bacterium]